MRPISIHTGAWRYPGAWPDANFNLAHIRQLIAALEAAKFDAFFMADHLAVLNMPEEALKRSQTVSSFEPFTLLSSLAMVTERIGLIATASTTYEEPFHVARRFASLDHISGGRAGWNLAAGKAFYADIKARMTPYGRDPDHLKILPAAFVVVGETMAEAQANRERLDATSRSRMALTPPPRLMPGRCSPLVPQISREAIP